MSAIALRILELRNSRPCPGVSVPEKSGHGIAGIRGSVGSKTSLITMEKIKWYTQELPKYRAFLYL
jgi:hypothetical protein